MNELKTFKHPMFGELPVVVLEGKEYFGATDVAKALEYKQPEHAVKNHCDKDGCISYTVIDKLGRNQHKNFITLGNVSRLIVAASKQSKNPEIQQKAKVYEKWIFDEVIPTVHKTGGYVQENRAMDFVETWLPHLDEHTKQAVASTLETNRKLLTENKTLKSTINELKPKADYTDIILKNKGLVTIGQIAKDYGMSGIKMNELLHELKVQYKQSGQWLLYAKHQADGYTHSDTINITRSDGSPDVQMHTKWTQKGRLFVYDLLKKNGILPMIERDFQQVR